MVRVMNVPRMAKCLCVVATAYLEVPYSTAFTLASFPGLRPEIYISALEKMFLHGCEIRSEWRPGNEATFTLCAACIYPLCCLHLPFVLLAELLTLDADCAYNY